MREFTRHWKWLVVLAVLPALWWHPLLIGMLPDFMDTVAHLYPRRLEV